MERGGTRETQEAPAVEVSAASSQLVRWWLVAHSSAACPGVLSEGVKIQGLAEEVTDLHTMHLFAHTYHVLYERCGYGSLDPGPTFMVKVVSGPYAIY